MAVNQISLSQINNELQSIYAQINSIQARVNQFYADVVTGIGLTALQAAPYSYSSADAQAVMNSVTDMYHLFQVCQGLWYVASGGTLNGGAPTANDPTHFGYPFYINIAKTGGLGY